MADPDPPNNGTEYLILERSEIDERMWVEVARITARSAEHAKRQHGQPGTFVAVPARSFTPTTYRSETVTKLVAEDTQSGQQLGKPVDV